MARLFLPESNTLRRSFLSLARTAEKKKEPGLRSRSSTTTGILDEAVESADEQPISCTIEETISGGWRRHTDHSLGKLARGFQGLLIIVEDQGKELLWLNPALGFESFSPLCFWVLTQTRVLVRWLVFLGFVCLQKWERTSVLYDVFVWAYWSQAVSLFTQTRVLVGLREAFLGLFIFGKVGKNFCIRCFSLGLMVSSFFTCWCR